MEEFVVKKSKYIFGLLTAVILVFSSGLNSEVFAEEPDTAEVLTEEPDTTEVLTEEPDTAEAKEFNMLYQAEQDNDTIGPLSTWYGSAGTIRLDYLESSGQFSWGIVIAEAVKDTLLFTGTIEIYTQSTNAYKGTIYVSGSGVGRISELDGIPSSLNLRRGTNYRARFSGLAVNGTTGKKYYSDPLAYADGINFLYR